MIDGKHALRQREVEPRCVRLARFFELLEDLFGKPRGLLHLRKRSKAQNPGQYLFLTVGDRQRMTPAKDPDQALGKILRLTLDGKPAGGNPRAGKTGATSVFPRVPIAAFDTLSARADLAVRFKESILAATRGETDAAVREAAQRALEAIGRRERQR